MRLFPSHRCFQIGLFWLFCIKCLLWGQVAKLPLLCNTACPGGAAYFPRYHRLSNAFQCIEFSAYFHRDSNQAIWDIPVQINLSQTAALKLLIYNQASDSIRQAECHLQFGPYWYGTAISLPPPGQWREIILPKHLFQPENGTGSWAACERIRFSLRKKMPGKATIYLGRLEFMLPTAKIAVLRGNSTSPPEESDFVNLCNTLNYRGIYPAVLDAEDTFSSALRPFRMVLLPDGHSLTQEQQETMRGYIRTGGKVCIVGQVPPLLTLPLNLPTGRKVNLAKEPAPGTMLVPDRAFLPDCPLFPHAPSTFVAFQNVPAGCKVIAWWINQETNMRCPAILETNHGLWITGFHLHTDYQLGSHFLLNLLERTLPGLQKQAVQAQNTKDTHSGF